MELFNQEYKLEHISKFINFFKNNKKNIKHEKDKNLYFLNNFKNKFKNIDYFKEIDSNQFYFIEKNYENLKNQYKNNLFELNKFSILINSYMEKKIQYENDITSSCKEILNIIYPNNLLNNNLNMDKINKLNIQYNNNFLDSLIDIKDSINNKNFNYYQFYSLYLKNIEQKELIRILMASQFDCFINSLSSFLKNKKDNIEGIIYEKFDNFKKTINWENHPLNKYSDSFVSFIVTLNRWIAHIEYIQKNHTEYLKHNVYQYSLEEKYKILKNQNKIEKLMDNKTQFFIDSFSFSDFSKLNFKNLEMLCKKYNTNYLNLLEHLNKYNQYNKILNFIDALEDLNDYIKLEYYNDKNLRNEKELSKLIDIIFNLTLVKDFKELEINKLLPLVKIFRYINDHIDNMDYHDIKHTINFKIKKIEEVWNVDNVYNMKSLFSHSNDINIYSIEDWNIKDIQPSYKNIELHKNTESNISNKLDLVVNF